MATQAQALPADFFVPEVAAEHAFSAFTDKLYVLQMALASAAGSPIVVRPPGDLTMKGERLVMPYFKRISSLVSRRNIATTTVPTDLTMSGTERGNIILRRKAGPVTNSLDVFKLNGVTPATYSAELGMQIGQEMFKEMQARVFDMLNTVIQGLTFNGTSHLKDYYAPYAASASTTSAVNNTMSLLMLNQGKAVMGDSMSELTTAILSSVGAADLIALNIQVGYDSIAGHDVVTGLPRTVGMGDPLVMDLTEVTSTNPSGSRTGSGSGTGTASYTMHRAYLLGPGCIEIMFPHNLELFSELRLDGEAPYTRVLGNFDFGIGMPGVGYKTASTANPTNAQLRTSTNWQDRTTGGHREVRAVIVQHNRSVDT